MRKLAGKTAGAQEYRNVDHNCDILDYEIPLLSLFQKKRKFLFRLWVEREGSVDRYLMFTVSPTALQDYFAGKLSLRAILEDADRIIAFESREGRRRNIRFVRFVDLFEDYIPDEDSYFDPKYSTDEAVELAESQLGSYFINIDGDWYLEDWSEFTRVYKQVYAFNYAIKNIDEVHVAQRVGAGLHSLPFRGGYSIVNVIGSMQDSIPATGRVRVGAIRYSSPGYIQLKVDVDVAKYVENVMNAVGDDDAFDGLRDVYRECNRFLESNGLKEMEAHQFNREYALYEDLSERLRQYALEILVRTGHEADVPKLVQNETILPLVKTLLAYVRRIVQLRRYLNEGLVIAFGGQAIDN